MDASSSTAIPGTSARPDPGLPAAGTPPTSGRARLGRLSGLDGLRAVAVAAVLLYHADVGLLPGGFLGVDLFFVISGFLITVLLLVEWQATGRLDLPAFWLRRARRLLPALYALLLGVLAFAVLVLPGEVARLRGDAAAALGYITNWYLVVGQQSYFDAIGRPSPLRHLWSLAVEEQFYVGWPILLAGLLALRRPRLAFAATVGLAALSGAWMAVLFVPDADPSRAYYGTDTRLAGLLIGAALAFLWSCRREDGGQEGDGRPPWDRRSAALDGLGLVALAVVVAAFALADDAAPLLYRGGFSAFAVAGAVLIATVTRPASRLGRLLGVRPLRWLGERSYAIYLWHWPVFVLTRPGLDVPLDPLADLVPRLALTLVLADVSYRLVERPIRGGALGRAWTGWRAQRRRAVRAGSAAVLLAGSAAVAVLA
ncbi:MAG TPA: acyltransferase, partial [Candidatus Limnocylindrales bacterium]